MIHSQDNTEDIFGCVLDESNKNFTFYNPLEDGNFLYAMYDSDSSFDGSFNGAADFSSKGLIRLNP